MSKKAMSLVFRSSLEVCPVQPYRWVVLQRNATKKRGSRLGYEV